MKSTLSVLWLAALAAGSSAQATPVPARPGSRPLVRVGVAGPSLWRQEFLATDVGGLLSAKECQAWLAPWVGGLRKALGPFGESAAWRALRDYQGRLELDLFVTYHPQANPQYRTLVVGRLAGDGETDLAALGVAAAAALRGFGELRRVDAGGEGYEVVSIDGMELTLPRLRGSDLIVVGGDDVGTAMPRAVAAFEAMRQRAAPGRRPPLDVVVDLQELATLAIADSASDRRRVASEVLFGIATLGELRATLSPAGPRVQLELSATFTGSERGIFRGLFPDVQGAPRLVRLLPQAPSAWKASRLRLDLITDSLIEAMAVYMHGGDRAKVDAMVRRELGADPVKDLFAHLGDEVLLLRGAYAPTEAGGMEAMVDGSCAVFEVADAATFDASWARLHRLVEAWWPELTESEHDGVVIESLARGITDDSMHICRAGELVVVAFGEGGLELMRGVLTRQRTKTTNSMPATVQRALRHAPPGFNGAAAADVRAVISDHLGSLLEALDDVVPSGLVTREDAAPALAALAPAWDLLVAHELDGAVGLTGFANGRWTFRLLW